MKQLDLTTAVAALFLLGTVGCSQARESADAPARPAVLETIEARGFEVLGEFDAPGDLRGFAGLAGQQPMAAYVTADGEYLLVGTLINSAGEDVGQPYLQKLVAEPMSQRIWEKLEDSHWVADGSDEASRVVYAFSDANCPYCHRFWEAARPWVESGKVQLRHVMVGVIREDSANKAAAILEAESPPDMLARNELAFASGGIEGTPTVSASVRRKLDANQLLMLELGFQGTPGIVFRDSNGIVQRRSGMPTPADLPVVLGPRG